MPDCRPAFHKPLVTIQSVISDLHPSFATFSPSANQLSAGQTSLDVNYVDRRYVRRNMSSRSGNRTNQDPKCLFCQSSGCWSTNHSTKERLEALQINKQIRQFIANHQDKNDSEEGDRQMADGLKGVTAHSSDLQFNSDDEDNNDTGPVLSHLAIVDDSEHCAAFTASLQDAAVPHALTTCTPPSRYAGKFYAVMIDSGCARGSDGGHSQYLEYYYSRPPGKSHKSIQHVLDTANSALVQECHKRLP